MTEFCCRAWCGAVERSNAGNGKEPGM